MRQTNIPYEFLVRWDHTTGVLKGAHVKVYTTVLDDTDAVLMQQAGDAQPVAMAGALGFPLETILDAVHSGAITAADEANAAKARAETALAQAEAALAAETRRASLAEGALAKALEEIASMNTPVRTP